MKAIPTSYRGTQLRSRLEARWAATFDLLHWPWEYEPVDLDGYIPDFALLFHEPLMVEIKPALTLAELYSHTAKIDGAGVIRETLLLGATTRFPDSEWPRNRWETLAGSQPRFGLLGAIPHPEVEPAPVSRWWSEAVLFGCTNCRRESLHHETGSWHCRVNGCYDGDHYLGAAGVDLDATWTTAGNAVQWKPVARV